MKSIIASTLISISLLSTGSTPALAQLPPLSPTASSEPVLTPGSLANEILINDTVMTLVEHGYIKPQDDIIPFVIDQPSGAYGTKTWRDLWVTTPDHRLAYFAITFTEDGKGSADFAMTPIYE